MEWNGLIIAAKPSWLALREEESFIYWLLVGRDCCLRPRRFTPRLCTLPVQRRPDYKTYQQTTNMFLPGPNK